MTNEKTVFREDDDRSENVEHDDFYEIRFKGHLSDRWSSRFPEFVLTRKEDGTTLMVGPVEDQSALYGLINQVRDLGLTLISVNKIASHSNTPI